MEKQRIEENIKKLSTFGDNMEQISFVGICEC